MESLGKLTSKMDELYSQETNKSLQEISQDELAGTTKVKDNVIDLLSAEINHLRDENKSLIRQQIDYIKCVQTPHLETISTLKHELAEKQKTIEFLMGKNLTKAVSKNDVTAAKLDKENKVLTADAKSQTKENVTGNKKQLIPSKFMKTKKCDNNR